MGHGIYITESPTSVVSAKSSGTITVAVGIAPVNLADAADRKVNEPVLCYSEGEVHKYLGKSQYIEDYGLSEVSDVFFKLYNVAPVVFVNVLDPEVHKKSVADEVVGVSADKGTLAEMGVMLETVVVKSDDGSTVYVEGTDYVVAFDEDENAVVSLIDGGGIGATFKADYDHIDPSMVDKDDIIGGEDAQGIRSGLEIINDVYSKLRVVPRQLIHPGWNETDVVAIGNAKMQSILGTCKGMQWVDGDCTTVDVYTAVPAWKQTSNIKGINQMLCWPMVTLGDDKYHMSTHAAALKASVDVSNDDVPSESPSNKSMVIDGVVLANGTEVSLDQARANYLNENGIVTALDLKLWGNYTAARSETTDVKDTFIPVRDMFNWAGISTVLTFANKIDKPGNRNLIESIVDSKNIWFNGLTADGHIYGGRMEFRSEDNVITDLLDGKFTYKTYMSPVIPHQEMVEDMEYDPSYLETLFG